MIKKTSSEGKSKKINISEFWTSLESLCAESPDLLAQINMIKGREQRKVTNWQSDVVLLLTGLRAGIQSLPDQECKASQLEKIDNLTAQAKEIPIGQGELLEFVLIALTCISGVVCVAYVGFLNWFLLPMQAIASIAFFAVCVGALRTYLRSRYVLKTSTKKQLIQTFAGTVVTWAIFSLLSFVLVLIVMESSKKYSENDSKINLLLGENADFARRFLAENYNIPLIVEPSPDIWINAYTIAGGGSPAAIQPSPKLCRLIYSERGLDQWIGIKNPDFKDAFKKVITMHEIGHCVHISKDFENITADGKFLSPLQSFPKDLSTKIKSIKDVEALDKNEALRVTLYQEAVADLFALGYAKIHYKSQYNEIANYLRDKRKHKGDHHTYCWINKAFDISPPNSDSELAEWAIQLVDTFDCSIKKELKNNTPTKLFEEIKRYF